MQLLSENLRGGRANIYERRNKGRRKRRKEGRKEKREEGREEGMRRGNEERTKEEIRFMKESVGQ